MKVRVILMGDPFRVRKCGCIAGETSDWFHWWRFTRIRLWCRQLGPWVRFQWLRWQVWSHTYAIRVASEYLVPTAVGMEIMSPPEGLEWLREGDRRVRRWMAWFKSGTLLGASSDYPEGIYDEDGTDGVCMTEEEYNHWYAGR